jgi:type II secretory pathway component PulF
VVVPRETGSRASAPRLTGAAAAEIVEKIVEVGESRISTVAAIRAAADESNRRLVRAALRRIADEVERGVPLTFALSAQAAGFPRFLQGLVAAASRTGQLPAVLEECLVLQRNVQDTWRILLTSLFYPAVILGLVTSLMVILFSIVVPEFKTLFEDFGLVLPGITQALIRASDTFRLLCEGAGALSLIGLTGGAVLLLLFIRVAIGKPNWRWMMGTLPLIGPLWSWSGAATFARTLAPLVDHQLPLPEALELSCEGISDANVQEACRRFSRSVSEGSRLSDAMAASRRLPRTLIPFVQAGEERGELADALRTAGDVFFERMRLRALLLRSVVPPIVFVFVTMFVLLTVAGLFMPLFELLRGLA